MSNDVVISKELRDELLTRVPYGKLDQALRAAPETVSLEGVRILQKGFWFDLLLKNGFYSTQEANAWALKIVETIQSNLPQPVAPVQGVGVVSGDLNAIDSLVTNFIVRNNPPPSGAPNEHWQQCQDRMRDHKEELIQALAHLPTTQSAPSVGSIPTITQGEINKAFNDAACPDHGTNGWFDTDQIVKGLLAIGALLTSRTEGK